MVTRSHTMATYHLRPATLDDLEALVHHRMAMFSDMGTPVDAGQVEATFRRWLQDMMAAGHYRAWVVHTDDGEIVSGGGITVLPWPPGPYYCGGRIAFVYNVYTDRPHRRRGLARLVMEAIHLWCRDTGIGLVGLNASAEGRPLYDELGYQPAGSPMMFAAVDRD
jgi:GNAT superfamily N-acetyltransferase